MKEARTVRRLPRSLDDIRGLRVARWIRESTAGQYDRYGPASQREQQDRFIDRHGLVDTGLVFQVAHSGTTVWRSATMAEMLDAARAGGVRPAARRLLRPLAAQPPADARAPRGRPAPRRRRPRHVRPADPVAPTPTTGTSSSARRPAPRSTAAACRSGSPTAMPPSSTTATTRAATPASASGAPSEPPHVLEVDPATIGTLVALFERYALGSVSAKDLAEETGLAESRIRMILMNPIYNGWIRRYRRSRSETRKPAPWRADPPVSDELWARVEDVRRSKTRAGGPRRPDRVDLLKGLLECVCGRRVRSDGTFADGRHRKLHANPCEAWGKRARLGDEVWEEPILAQLEAIELDDATISAVVASLGTGPRPVALDQARIDRQIRELALEHAAGRLEDAAYLERLHELRDAKENLERTSTDGISPERAVAWLEALSATWRAAVATSRTTPTLPS